MDSPLMTAIHAGMAAAIAALWYKLWIVEGKLEKCLQGKPIDEKQTPV